MDRRTSHQEVKLQLPLPVRALVLILGSTWWAAVVLGCLRSIQDGHTAASIGYGAFLPGILLVYRSCRLSVVGEGSDLLIRNFFRTIRVPRADIRDFRQLQRRPSEATLAIIRRDGTRVPMTITRVWAVDGWYDRKREVSISPSNLDLLNAWWSGGHRPARRLFSPSAAAWQRHQPGRRPCPQGSCGRRSRRRLPSANSPRGW